MDLLVILNCLIHNLWEEMISYELQMHPWNHLFSTGCSKCCICHRDHMELFCSETGGRIVLSFLVHMNSCASMQIPRMVCVISCLEPNQNIPLLWTKKRHKHHLIPLVWFIWGHIYPIPLHETTTRVEWDGCVPVEKGLSFLYQALLLGCCHSISLFFDWCFTLSCH